MKIGARAVEPKKSDYERDWDFLQKSVKPDRSIRCVIRVEEQRVRLGKGRLRSP